jgi:hypothetical protein
MRRLTSVKWETLTRESRTRLPAAMGGMRRKGIWCVRVRYE